MINTVTLSNQPLHRLFDRADHTSNAPDPQPPASPTEVPTPIGSPHSRALAAGVAGAISGALVGGAYGGVSTFIIGGIACGAIGFLGVGITENILHHFAPSR